LCCHKESNDSILIAIPVSPESQPRGWLFFRPRALPDDAGDNGGGRRKIPEITSSA
jgi:hypothetical protein